MRVRHSIACFGLGPSRIPLMTLQLTGITAVPLAM
jgi:hypothetical protein